MNDKPKVFSFDSCEQLNQDVLAYDRFLDCQSQCTARTVDVRAAMEPMRSKKSAGPAEGSATSSTSSQADVLTNVRHAGIDEGDIIKVAKHQIFVTDLGQINVLDRKSKKHFGAVRLPADIGKNTEPLLLTTGNQLIVSQNRSLLVYELVQNRLPKLRQQKNFDHEIVELRLLKQDIVAVTKGFFNTPRHVSASNPLNLSPAISRKTYPSSHRHFSNRTYTHIERMPVADIHQSSSIVFLGENKIYMNDKSIYLYEQLSEDSTVIKKIRLDNPGSLRLSSSGKIKGRIKDVWALSELPGGELAVATTSGELFDNSAINHFMVLAESDKQLKKIGETNDYGAKEDIRSVRFVGSIAYVVTFKKTDPLFAIDVSEASNPKILGELKMPGFSTYMHPLSNDRLIGLGFDAIEIGDVAINQGLQLSLFNTSDPRNLSRSAVQIVGQRGSASAATTDHRAFFMDSQAGVVGFPVQLNLNCNPWERFCSNPSDAIGSRLSQRHGQFRGAALVKKCRYPTNLQNRW